MPFDFQVLVVGQGLYKPNISMAHPQRIVEAPISKMVSHPGTALERLGSIGFQFLRRLSGASADKTNAIAITTLGFS